MLKIKGYLKFWEVDDFENGCDPDTSQSYFDTQFNIQAETELELVEKVKGFFNTEDDSIVLNSCDEDGRIDVQLMEDEEGCQPTKQELAQWKKGKKKLFCSTYSLYTEKTETFKFSKHPTIQTE